MVIIEPLGTNVLLPAFVIGFELPEGDAYDRVSRWDSSPDWIVTFDQQAGGMCMRYPSVVGAVLRLTDNTEHFRSDPAFVVRGFRAMAEDPQLNVLQRDYPVLRRLVNTWGEDYNLQQLRGLEGFLAHYLVTPSVESGFEAFVRFAGCDVLQYFADWNLLQVEVLPTFREVFRNQVCPRVEEGNLDGLSFRSEIVLNAEKISGLQQLGELVRQSQPRVFLLWENCD
jgi:hypothetical protein